MNSTVGKFEKGEKVLVEARYCIPLSCVTDDEHLCRGLKNPSKLIRGKVHPHPGVSVAALLEEVRIAERLLERRQCAWTGHGDFCSCDDFRRYRNLQNKRHEDTQHPEYRKGDEVWVRGEYLGNGQVKVSYVDEGPTGYTHRAWNQLQPDPDDIRPAGDDDQREED